MVESTMTMSASDHERIAPPRPFNAIASELLPRNSLLTMLTDTGVTEGRSVRVFSGPRHRSVTYRPPPTAPSAVLGNRSEATLLRNWESEMLSNWPGYWIRNTRPPALRAVLWSII